MNPVEKPRVLIADPDDEARRQVEESLALTAVDLVEAESAREALAAIDKGGLDLVVTELKLPDSSGFVLCRHLREPSNEHDVPVIVLSQWANESDRILAFECGADDFVAKPWYARELSSRVEAVLSRRRTPTEAPAPRPAPRARMPAGEPLHRPREVLFDGKPLGPTPKERALLGALASAGGRVLSRQDLITIVWGGAPAPMSRSIDSHIKSLRRKLGQAPDCVETVRGVGYRFTPHPLLDLR
jgi:two-component system phosphate regulon response regulator PhoB